jgi:hypothetical protein
MATSVNSIAQQRTWNDLAKSLKSFSDAMSNKGEQSYYSTPAPYESPQNYQSQYQSNPYQVDFQQLDQTRSRANEDALRGNQLANQNAENSANREIRKTQATNKISDSSYANQKQIDLNNAIRQQQLERSNKTITASTSVRNYSASDEAQRLRSQYEQQKHADARKYNASIVTQQQNNAATLKQQQAQQQAQERLARIGQQTSIYQSIFGGSPGQSSWRWF